MRPILSKYIFSFLLLLFSISGVLTAQQYNFKNYTPKNGLANSIVNSIFQDSKGYIWFGTQGGGVSRFDGSVFKNYNKEAGLVDNDVTYITEDKKGNIWIATSAGVSQFDGVSFKNYTAKDGLANGVVYCIYADEKNTIWFAVQEGGVNIYDGNKFTQLSVKDGLPSNNVFTISQDKNKNYWFGMSNGIAKYDGSRVTSYDKKEGINNKTFFSSFVDSKGVVWFGGIQESGVIRYTGNHFENFVLPASVANDFIGSITEDNKNNMWFATDHGALKYDGKQFLLFTEKEGLASNYVLSLCHDYENNIWIGTQDGGVNLFNNESFVNYTEKDGLLNKNVVTITQESDDRYIIGSSGLGLSILNAKTNTFSPFTTAKEALEFNVRTTLLDKSKQFWVGTQDGVFVFQKEKELYQLKKSIKRINNTDFTAVIGIVEAADNSVWLGSYGSGIAVIQGDKIVLHNKANGFISDNILTIYEDSKSNIWIGTKDEGLIKYDGQRFTQFSGKEGLTDKGIWCITEDKKGNIYLGTNESGVFIFDGKKFKSANISDGLCSNYVSGIVYDPIDDCIWIGTEKGINKIKFSDYFEVVSIRFYGEQEGYKGIATNSNAVILDTKGMMWFGGINGLARYNRKYDFPNITPPKLRINGIKLAYQQVDWANYADSVDRRSGLPLNLELSHKNNSLSFDFQAFTTDNVKYTFILEGQDEQWSPLSPNSEAVFTNISPGKTYTFKVKAVNSYGVWSDEMVAFSFMINPPWWQTWWFYTLAILIVGAGVFGFINYRTAQLAKEKKVLEEKVTERTVELKDANDKLSVAFQDIKDSINYAKKIQNAILPLDEEIKKALPQSFVLFQPRDVVSGDFYWFNRKDHLIYIAAVDCTGHGVPGAFMSMIGSSLLNEIISKKGNHDAAGVLKKLHLGVRKSLKQDRDSYESKDGMDLALAVIDTNTNSLQYAGAKRSLFAFINGEFSEVKADKQSIGGLEMKDDYTFQNHNFPLQKGDTFYLFTDGYVDQFGGEKGKKYSTKRLKERLTELQSLSLSEQCKTLEKDIVQWKSDLEQVDDILVIGLRF